VPHGELRGGAWVVVDPSINPNHIEMFADVDSRAGVLQPEGIVEIKMRREKILSLMERLDAPYSTLKKESKDASLPAEARAKAADSLIERENELQSTYKQIALLYADLHDHTGRMEAKGCAKAAVWRDARRHFYWLLRSRLARDAALSRMEAEHPQATREYRLSLLDTLVSAAPDNRATAEELENLDLTNTLTRLRGERTTHSLQAMANCPEDRSALFSGLAGLVGTMSEEERSKLLTALKTIPLRSNDPPSYSSS